MEVNNVAGAYTTAAKAVETDEEKKNKQVSQEEEKDEKIREYKQDKIDLTKSDDFDETGIEEKANNYIANILVNPKLTEDSKKLVQQYMQTFDAAKFIKMYGPFTTTSEVSAAMYAVTSHMIKYQDE